MRNARSGQSINLPGIGDSFDIYKFCWCCLLKLWAIFGDRCELKPVMVVNVQKVSVDLSRNSALSGIIQKSTIMLCRTPFSV